MKENKILTGFASSTDTDLKEQAHNAVEAMTNNPIFAGLENQIEAVRVANKNFEETAVPLHLECKETVNEKRKMRNALIPALRSLAYAIMAMAGNDRATLESSGFRLNSMPVKTTLPETPEQVKAFLINNDHAILMTCKKDKNAKTYKVRVSADQENWQWTNAGSSAKIFVTDLPLGQILYAQMATKNSLGQSTWSQSELVRLPQTNEPQMARKNVSLVVK